MLRWLNLELALAQVRGIPVQEVAFGKLAYRPCWRHPVAASWTTSFCELAFPSSVWINELSTAIIQRRPVLRPYKQGGKGFSGQLVMLAESILIALVRNAFGVLMAIGGYSRGRDGVRIHLRHRQANRKLLGLSRGAS